MKKNLFAPLLIATALALPAFAAEDHTPKHGGVVVETKADKTEAPLALIGDKLEAKGSFKLGAGTKVLADLTVNGKPAVAARFTLK